MTFQRLKFLRTFETDPASIFDLGLSKKQIADAVLRASDFYLKHPGQKTPWQDVASRSAQLSYFLPLNSLRMSAALTESLKWIPAQQISEVWDFGAGLGATQWACEDVWPAGTLPFYAIESSAEAIALYRDILNKFSDMGGRENGLPINPQFVQNAKPRPGALAVFSYSFLEIKPNPRILEDFDHILIVEPSTEKCARDLMTKRKSFIESGYRPLAPCTHSGECPLLKHSSSDWCHMRIHIDPSQWFLDLEQMLPIKNRSLTYSYLLVSRSASLEQQDSPPGDRGRVIGDTLEENGKTRQLICRGEEREFLSWLHRRGPPPQIPWGTIVDGLNAKTKKGNELRDA